jgi:tetratricopeptide (TPR) repeat protein
MPADREPHYAKHQRQHQRQTWLREGLSIDQIAHRFRQTHNVGALTAYRWANNQTQLETANTYSEQFLDPDERLYPQRVSEYEEWPHEQGGREPPLSVLERFAVLYHTTPTRLITAILNDRAPEVPAAHKPIADRLTGSAMAGHPAARMEHLAFQQVDGFDGDAALRRPQTAVEAFGDDDLWQLARAMRASNIDTAMLDQMEMSILRTHWVYASLAPGELFPAVQARLRTIAELLAQPQPIAVRGRLCVIAGHLAGLRAWLMFDLGDHQGALAVYDRALEPATEAGDDALCGWLLGGKSLIPSYAGDPKAALEVIQHGQRHAARSGNLTCQAWLAALEARAHAGIRDAAGYWAAQNRANQAVSETRLEERRHGMDFDGDKLSLSYYEGTSLATLGEPRDAQPVLRQALQVQGRGHLKARSIVLIALASTYIQQKEIEEACRLAGEALATPPPQQRIGPIAQRAADLRVQLAPWRMTSAVKAFDEQLAALQPVGRAR